MKKLFLLLSISAIIFSGCSLLGDDEEEAASSEPSCATPEDQWNKKSGGTCKKLGILNMNCNEGKWETWFECDENGRTIYTKELQNEE